MDTKRPLDPASPITGLGSRTARPGTVKARVARGGAVKYASVPPKAKPVKAKLTAKEQGIAGLKEILAHIADHPDAAKFKQELNLFKDLLG